MEEGGGGVGGVGVEDEGGGGLALRDAMEELRSAMVELRSATVAERRAMVASFSFVAFVTDWSISACAMVLMWLSETEAARSCDVRSCRAASFSALSPRAKAMTSWASARSAFAASSWTVRDSFWEARDLTFPSRVRTFAEVAAPFILRAERRAVRASFWAERSRSWAMTAVDSLRRAAFSSRSPTRAWSWWWWLAEGEVGVVGSRGVSFSGRQKRPEPGTDGVKREVPLMSPLCFPWAGSSISTPTTYFAWNSPAYRTVPGFPLYDTRSFGENDHAIVS